jgi:hypothetical protein
VYFHNLQFFYFPFLVYNHNVIGRDKMKNKFVFSMLFLGLGVILSSCNNDRKPEESTTVETTTDGIETKSTTTLETTTKPQETTTETTTETVVETTTETKVEVTSTEVELPWV